MNQCSSDCAASRFRFKFCCFLPADASPCNTIMYLYLYSILIINIKNRFTGSFSLGWRAVGAWQNCDLMSDLWASIWPLCSGVPSSSRIELFKTGSMRMGELRGEGPPPNF